MTKTITIDFEEWNQLNSSLSRYKDILESKSMKVFIMGNTQGNNWVYIFNADESAELLKENMDAAIKFRDIVIELIETPKRSDKYAAEDAMNNLILDKLKQKGDRLGKIWNFIFRKFWYGKE